MMFSNFFEFGGWNGLVYLNVGFFNFLMLLRFIDSLLNIDLFVLDE